MGSRFFGWSSRRALTTLVAALAVSACGAGAAFADDKDKSKSVGAFGEGRRGDVPEGTLEMLTPDTDPAIQKGLGWLARSQNADGSFGSGTYRGNIAVTSLAGLAFMAAGSSPGRGPYGGGGEEGPRHRLGEKP